MTSESVIADRVFLTDFGLAKNIATGSRYTRTGETLGTPAYMSPEQARGELTELTAASDVWALGCVLYECLAGRPAFEGDTAAAVIARLLTAEPPSLRDVPRGARDMTAVCLQKAADRRHQSGATLRDDCLRVLDGRLPLTRPVRRLFPARWLTLAAAALALSGAVAHWWSRSWTTDTPGPDTLDVPTEDIGQRAWASRHEDLSAAILMLTGALRDQPDQQEWRWRLGVLEWAAGHNQRARARWEAIPERSSTRRRADLSLAFEALFGVRESDSRLRWDEALPHLRRLAVSPDPEGRLARAGIALCRADFDRALQIAEGIDGWQSALIRAMAANRAGDLARTTREYVTALSAGPPFAWASYNLGRAREQMDDPEGAQAAYEAALAIRPDFASAHHNLGQLRLRAGDVRAARRAFDAAIASDPEHFRSFVALGLLAHEEGDLDGALAEFDRALQIKPSLVSALANRANVHLDKGNLEQAERDCTAALAAAPTLLAARFNRAEVRRHRGDFAGALRDLDAVLAADPEADHAHNNRGRIRAEMGDFEGAIEDFTTAIERNPEEHTSWFNRAGTRTRSGDRAGAISDLRRVLELKPDHPAAHGALGVLYGKERTWALATRHLRRAIELGPNDSRTPKARKLLAFAESQLRASSGR